MRINLSLTVFAALLSALSMTACRSRGPVEPELEYAQGRVVATTMNDIVLLVSSDSVKFSTVEADPFVVPGVLLDDVVKIGYVKTRQDGATVRAAQSLEFLKRSPYFYIKGTWSAPVENPVEGGPTEQGFILRNDGTARSIGKFISGLKAWKLVGNTLTLISETEASVSSKGKKATKGGKKVKEMMDVTDVFNIVSIDSESLVLARGDKPVVTLKRKN